MPKGFNWRMLRSRSNMKNTILLTAILCLFAFQVKGQSSAFDDRRQTLLAATLADYQQEASKPSARNAFWRAEALFELGKREEARVLVHRGLDQLVPGNRENRWIHGGNSGFVAWPGADCYVRYESFLDAALKKRYREIYTGAVFYHKLSTSNHKIMAAVNRYLATQIWGADAFHPDPFFGGKEDAGAFFDKGDPTGEKYIRATIQQTFTEGPGEYASRPYGSQNVLPLLSVAECSADSDLRERARMAYEYALIQLAPAYLRGHLATFAPRSYPDAMTQCPSGIAALMWAYFGGVPPENLPSQWALRAATAKYRLPEILQPAGTDRSKPYVYRALINRWALTHFVNSGYVLFSRSPKAAAKQFYGQSYPCGVMWDEPDVSKSSHLWITNPAADTAEQIHIHTHGVTLFEQELQHRDALLYVFNIPADFRNPYVLGYVPGGYRASLTEPNRIYLHYGSVLVAVSSSAPFEWNPKSGIRVPATEPHAGDSEFRVMRTKAAIAIETALPAGFPGATPEQQLAAFRERVVGKSVIELQPGEKPSGRYTDRDGNKLECTFDGEDKINGTVVDYRRWPALESPWTRQALPGGPLEVTDGKQTRTYDFQTGKSAMKP